MPVIVALNRFGSNIERELELIKKRLGEQGVEAAARKEIEKCQEDGFGLAGYGR